MISPYLLNNLEKIKDPEGIENLKGLNLYGNAENCLSVF